MNKVAEEGMNETVKEALVEVSGIVNLDSDSKRSLKSILETVYEMGYEYGRSDDSGHPED